MVFLTRPLPPWAIAPGLAILLGVGGLEPRPAQAHAIESSLERLQSLNQQLELHSHFSSGMPLDGAAVRLIPPGGGEGVLVGRTDGRGQLRFRLPQGVDQAWEVQVDGGAGHRDYLELPASPAAGQPTALSQGRRHDLLKGGLGERTAPLLAALLLGLIATSRGRRR